MSVFELLQVRIVERVLGRKLYSVAQYTWNMYACSHNLYGYDRYCFVLVLWISKKLHSSASNPFQRSAIFTFHGLQSFFLLLLVLHLAFSLSLSLFGGSILDMLSFLITEANCNILSAEVAPMGHFQFTIWKRESVCYSCWKEKHFWLLLFSFFQCGCQREKIIYRICLK